MEPLDKPYNPLGKPCNPLDNFDIDKLITDTVGKTTQETIEKLTFLINEWTRQSICPVSTIEEHELWLYKLSKLCEARKIEMTSLRPRPLFPIGTRVVVNDPFNSKHGIVGTIIRYVDYKDPRRIMVQISPTQFLNQYDFNIDIRLTKQFL